MKDFLRYYHGVSPTTWVYLSSLLMIALFFKFSRFWSVRNLDLILLILLSPGLLLIHFGRQIQLGEATEAPIPTNALSLSADDPRTDQSPLISRSAGQEVDSQQTELGGAGAEAPSTEAVAGEVAVEPTPSEAEAAGAGPTVGRGRDMERWGYVWLFCTGGILLARLLVDSMMVRRPLLAPNLSVGGMTFIGCSLFIFLMANVVAQAPPADDSTVEDPTQWKGQSDLESPASRVVAEGPGYAVLNILPHNTNKVLAIVSHLAVLLGVALVGYWHFDNITAGIGAATLYLMLPYTAQMTGRVDHVLPAALLVWAVLCYPKPLIAGSFVGLAGGLIYYPLFLLPLWLSFYWQRGLLRFLIGIVSMLVLLAAILAFIPAEATYWHDLQRMFGLWPPRFVGLDGIWNPEIGGWDPQFRLPVLAAFVVLCAGLALWPAQKNLGTLLSCSAAVMLATQFWHGYVGGTYIGWYLPLALLTIFRPNLEDRVAQTVLAEGWLMRRRGHASPVDKAA